ncbi:MAG: hypothetical protein J5I52_05055 [Saprospiraceae bacterium]|nr:MAG: hypothetical protein UZ09_BCD002002055 [Bacteroidetes bacterium OLB9]MCO6463499.1 hypothetical protein [Saprospiraceae bacterium]MCZ2339183.1 hypothetical protein [Chitinophagales bacterium]
MQRKFNFLLTIFLCVLFYHTTFAQTNDNSPYSRYGIGDLTDNHFGGLRQMGGLGASYIDAYQLNIVNPASYSFLNATVFDVGVFAKHTWLNDNINTSKTWTGNLEYISLAFPLTNPINARYDGVQKNYKLAMNITLMPHSTVNYNVAFADSLAGFPAFTRNYLGNGGTYKLLWGNAINYKNKLSFGLNLGYLFGNLEYERNILFPSTAYLYNDYFTTDYNVKGFLWNAGIIYSDIINKKAIEENKSLPAKRISVGINFNSANSFRTKSNISHMLEQRITASVVVQDTVQLVSNVAGKGKLPAEFGAGVTYYHGEKLAIGFNYSSAFWADYYNEASGESKGSLSTTQKFVLGGYYRPNYKSFDNYFDRVYYRYGAYYGTDPLVVNDKRIDTYGITFGLGMPFIFQRKVSSVNLGANLGIRGKNSPISEKFIKISLGVNFNDDEWFLKRKYN